MANQTLKTRIVLRNDTVAKWSSSNPVLLKGEMGVESDTGKFKFGDGVTAWNDLPYAVPELPEGIGEAKVYLVDVANGADHVEAITTEVGEDPLSQGDIAVVREAIDAEGTKRQYTAYVYNDSAWAAMDGNYNATNVYFPKDLTTTSAIGNITLSNGQATIAAKGKNLEEVWQTIFVKAKDPTVTQPSVSVSCPQAKAYEVGTKVTPSFTASFNKGSYQYGPDTAVTVSTWSVTDSNSSPAVAAATGSFSEITVSDGMNYKITATATHTAGVSPVNNIGEEKAALAIKAGTKVGSSGAITGYRAWFYGSSTSDITLDSASIRALTNKGACSAGAKNNLPVVEGAKCVVIAVPQGRTVTSVKDDNAFGTDIFGSFAHSQISVEGVDGYTAQTYNVYKYSPSAALGANTYDVTIA